MVLEADKRSAQFHTTLVVAAPGRESLVVEADWPGYIAFEPKGENGFLETGNCTLELRSVKV